MQKPWKFPGFSMVSCFSKAVLSATQPPLRDGDAGSGVASLHFFHCSGLPRREQEAAANSFPGTAFATHPPDAGVPRWVFHQRGPPMKVVWTAVAACLTVALIGTAD